MTTVKATTKRGEKLIEASLRYEGEYLINIYNSYSFRKEQAYKACRDAYYKEEGSNFHIISHNSFGFSVAWRSPKGLRIETPQNSYLIVFNNQ